MTLKVPQVRLKWDVEVRVSKWLGEKKKKPDGEAVTVDQRSKSQVNRDGPN